MSCEVLPLSTETIRLDEGDQFILTVDAEGSPVWWPNLYCSVAPRPTSIALSTMQARMSAVSLFHNWCVERDIQLDERLETFALLSMEEVAGLRSRMRINLRKPGAQERDLPKKLSVAGNEHWRHRLRAISDYLVWRGEHVISRMSVGDQRLPEARARLEKLPAKIIGKIRAHRNIAKEGLDEEQQRILLDAITPGHPTNPFSGRNQVRNFALWTLYFCSGIRRSEALILKGEDLHLNGSKPHVIVHRRPDDPDDPRAQEPKTKTQPHPIELSPGPAKIISDYMVFERPSYLGAKRSPYVFVSQKGNPLSLSAVVGMYRMLRKKVAGLPADFATHDLRRTWNDRFGDAAEAAGFNADIEKQVRNRYQG